MWFEVGFSGFPGFGDFDEHGGDEPLQRLLAGKETDDTGASFDLAVEGFAGIGGSQFSAIRLGQIKDCKAFGNVFLSPCNKLGLFVSPSLKKNAQPFLGLWTRLGVEDGGDLRRNEGLQVLFGDEVTGVLLKVKLTALPWTRVAGSAQSGF